MHRKAHLDDTIQLAVHSSSAENTRDSGSAGVNAWKSFCASIGVGWDLQGVPEGGSEGVIRILDRPAPPNPDWSGAKPDPGSSAGPWRVYNIGNNSPVELMDYIAALEKALGRKAEMELLPLQPGDVPDTFADVQDLVDQFGYKPATPVESGIAEFVRWYRGYYKV
jgi:hypothetical protein